MFSSAFSSAFAGSGLRYIAPMAAQAALHAGAVALVAGSGLLVNRRVLIGQAGGVYSFGSPESAARWVEKTRAAAAGEYFTRAQLAASDPDALAAWAEKKRKRMARRAVLVTEAAARQSDAAKRRALIEEAALALGKWA